jgi:hypothetical protein
MDDSKLSSALVFFVGNYFVTFFIIGLIAGEYRFLISQNRCQSAK